VLLQKLAYISEKESDIEINQKPYINGWNAIRTKTIGLITPLSRKESAALVVAI